MDQRLPPVLAEGKTKQIIAVPDTRVVRVVSNSNLSAYNGKRRAVLQGKDILATTTTVKVFQLLRPHVPLAFIGPVGENEFRAWLCTMLPFEIVVRRVALGSYLPRNPTVPEGTILNGPVVEFHLKTTGRKFKDIEFLDDDPIITTYDDLCLTTCRSDLVVDDNPVLVPCSEIDWKNNSVYAVFEILKALARKVFAVLEKAWERQGCTLQDLKIECGFGPDGNILVADVIDADSWRLLGPDGKRLDKQPFREWEPMNVVAKIYAEVAWRSLHLA